MTLFDRKDFGVFGIESFPGRMQAIRGRIQPKLAGIGESLAPVIGRILDRPVYAHVARHARRTVNPPDDTWVAFGADRRGYKKDVHFKVAVSARCVRVLFEVGPDYYDKAGWLRQWKREAESLAEALAPTRRLAWFRDEHDEDPAESLASLGPAGVRELGGELGRRREGQLVIGRRFSSEEILRMNPVGFTRSASNAIRPLAPLFRLHETRALARAASLRAP